MGRDNPHGDGGFYVGVRDTGDMIIPSKQNTEAMIAEIRDLRRERDELCKRVATAELYITGQSYSDYKRALKRDAPPKESKP